MENQKKTHGVTKASRILITMNKLAATDATDGIKTPTEDQRDQERDPIRIKTPSVMVRRRDNGWATMQGKDLLIHLPAYHKIEIT